MTIKKPNKQPLTKLERQTLEHDCQREANYYGRQAAIVKRSYNTDLGKTGMEYLVTTDLEFIPIEDMIDYCYPS